MNKFKKFSTFILAFVLIFVCVSNPIYACVGFGKENPNIILSDYLKDKPDIGDVADDLVLFFGNYYYLYNSGSRKAYFVKVDIDMSLRSVCLPGDPGYPRCDLYDPQPSTPVDIDYGEFSKCLLKKVFGLTIEDIGYTAFVSFVDAMRTKAFEAGAKAVMGSVAKAIPYYAALRTAYYSFVCMIES